MIKLLFSLILFACSKPSKPYAATPNESLKAHYEKSLITATQDFDQETGWPSRNDCDGTLWAGLALAAGVKSVKIALAEYSPGEIHRRPRPSCWNSVDGGVGSDTTVSRDMLTGYMWGLWQMRDLEAFKRLASYGEDHAWVMGHPLSDGKVIFSGNGVGALGRAIRSLGGPDKVYRHSPYFYSASGPDYAKHLTVLGILLQGAIDGAITSGAKYVLVDLAHEAPNDALFCAAASRYTHGDCTRCGDLLLNDYEYPSYVRGHESYKLVHWLFAASVALGGPCAKL